LEIRSAKSTDALAISTLIRSVAHFFTLHPEGVGAEAFLETVSPAAIEDLINAPNFRYLVGSIEGELAGVAAIRDSAHLYHLFISPVFQRQGMGRLLWHEAMTDAIRRGNPGTFTVNSTPFAVPVYQSFGFTVAGPKVETKGIAFVPMTFGQG
jgi:GNAT superfamily N-acetyltransferase